MYCCTYGVAPVIHNSKEKHHATQPLYMELDPRDLGVLLRPSSRLLSMYLISSRRFGETRRDKGHH